MNNEKKYNLFVFMSTFAKSLIDVFIPILLYEKGVDVKYIFIFLLCNYIVATLLNLPLGFIAKKISFKWCLVITSIFLWISYYFLFFKELNIINLGIILISHTISSHIYWLARHYYALNVLPEKNIADEVGNIIIFGQLASIPVSYFGALMMNNLGMEIVILIIIIVYIIGLIPLFKLIKIRYNKDQKLLTGVKKSLRDLPRKSYWFLILAQFKSIARYLFPLYLFIYVNKNYEYIGIFNVAVGIASIFFIYFFSRKMDKEKKDYLILSGVLGAMVYFFKLNITDTTLILLVGIVEGLTEKMYDVAFNRNLYALGKHYNPLTYAVTVEGLQNISRIILLFAMIILFNDIKIILYFCSFMIIMTGLIGFDDGEGGY